MSQSILRLLHDEDDRYVVSARVPGGGKSGEDTFHDRWGVSYTKAEGYLQIENRRRKRDVYVRYAVFDGTEKRPGLPDCKAAHATGCRSLVVDVDGNADGQSYASFDEAWEAAKTVLAACAGEHLPMPNLILRTGGGVQMAWVLEEILPIADWRAWMDALYLLLQGKGLRLDPLLKQAHKGIRYCADGIFNWKLSTPRRTKVIRLEARLPVGLVINALQPYRAQALSRQGGGSGPRLAVDNTLNKDFIGEDTCTPFQVAEVVDHCLQLRHAAQTGGRDLGYGPWINVLQVCSRDVDEAAGRGWAHKMSSAHPDYDEDVTNTKFDSFLGGKGILRCKTFHAARPEGCEGCPFWADPRGPGEGSPAKIPNELTRRQSAQRAASLALPDASFVNRTYGVVLVMSNGEELAVAPDYHIFDVELHEASGQEQEDKLTWTAATTSGSWQRKISLPLAASFDSTPLSRHLAGQGMVIPKYAIKGMQQAVSSWIQKLRDQQQARLNYTRLGWVDTDHGPEFVLGDAVVDAHGVRSLTPDRDRQGFGSSGTRAGYDAVVGALLRHETRDEAHALMATGFASPLMDLTGQPGAVLNWYSPRSGASKTTIARCTAGLWGNWRALHTTVDDTTNHLQRQLSTLHNLPCYFDELRVQDRRAFVNNVVFRIAQGLEKKRLSPDITMRQSGNWSTLLVFCTNFSFNGIVGGSGAQGDAGAVRYLEFAIDLVSRQPGATTPAQLANLLKDLDRHHGVVGRLYAEKLVRNRAQVTQSLIATQDWLAQRVALDGNDVGARLQVAAGACLIVGAKLARAWGLMPGLDPAAVMRAVAKALREAKVSREQALERASAADILRMFLKAHQPSSVTTVLAQSAKGKPPKKERHPHTIELPPPRLPLRYEVDCSAREVVVDRRELEAFVLEQGFNHASVLNEIRDNPKLYALDERVLAQGVGVGGACEVVVIKAGAALVDDQGNPVPNPFASYLR